jgi:hypothetical protein
MGCAALQVFSKVYYLREVSLALRQSSVVVSRDQSTALGRCTPLYSRPFSKRSKKYWVTNETEVKNALVHSIKYSSHSRSAIWTETSQLHMNQSILPWFIQTHKDRVPMLAFCSFGLVVTGKPLGLDGCGEECCLWMWGSAHSWWSLGIEVTLFALLLITRICWFRERHSLITWIW